MIYESTLCWDCKNAVPDAEYRHGCSWSRYGRPVKGWNAKRKDVYIEYGKSTESYMVYECPLFKEG